MESPTSKVKMYYQTSSPHVIREPFPRPTNSNEEETTGGGTRRSRSDSFESLLSLSVLASELLEDGAGDLEAEDISPKRSQHYSLAFPTPPTHSSPNFAHLYNSPSSFNDAQNHARTDSNLTFYSSEASNSINSVLTYSTQNTSEYHYAGSSSSRQPGSTCTFGIGIGTGTGLPTTTPSWHGTNEPIQKDAVVNVHEHIAGFVRHQTENGRSTEGSGYVEARQSPIGRDYAEAVEDHEKEAEPTTPLAFTGFANTAGQVLDKDDDSIRLADNSPQTTPTATVALDPQQGTQSPSTRPLPTSASIPPNMKISDWLKQQYDSGLRSPPRATPAASEASPSSSLPGGVTRQRTTPPRRKVVRISTQDQEAFAQLRNNNNSSSIPSISSPSTNPNLGIHAVDFVPNSPGAQHRAQLLGHIIAKDFSDPNVQALDAGRSEGAPPPGLWHPTEYVGPVKRPLSGMRRNRSTGSIFGLVVGGGGGGAGVNRRNSRTSQNMLDCISGGGGEAAFGDEHVAGRGRAGDDARAGLSRSTSALHKAPTHKRTNSAPGLSRWGRGSINKLKGNREYPDPIQQERDIDAGDQLGPGMHVYGEEHDTGNDRNASAAGSWRKMKEWGRVSMNDLLLPLSTPASPTALATATARRETSADGRSISTCQQPQEESAIPAQNAEATSAQKQQHPKHNRSLSSLASSLFSRASTSSPTRSYKATPDTSPITDPSSPHVRSTSEPSPVQGPSHSSPASRPRQVSSSTTSSRCDGTSPPGSPISRANNAATLEHTSPRETNDDPRQRNLSGSFFGDSLRSKTSLKRRNAKNSGPAVSSSSVARNREEGDRLADLASEQVARDAEYRSRLVSKFRPPTPLPLEEEGQSTSAL